MKIDVDALPRLQALVKAAGTNRAAAKQLEISEQHVGDLLHGRRGFSEAVLAKLGLRRTVVEMK